MPIPETHWKSVLLNYIAVKNTLNDTPNSPFKNEILQLLNSHIEQIQSKTSHLEPKSLLSNLLSELNIKIAKLSLSDNYSFERYKKLLNEIIDHLEAYKKTFHKDYLSPTTTKITARLNNVNTTQINENTSHFESKIFFTDTNALLHTSTYDYYIEALESFIIMELDRYLLLANPSHLKHFTQLTEHVSLTVFFDKIMQLNPLNFGGIIIILCCLHPTLLNLPEFKPYYSLIYHNNLSADIFQEARRKRLHEFIYTHVHKIFPNLTFNAPNFTVEENLNNSYLEIIKEEAEKNFSHLHLLQKKLKDSKAPITEIVSLADLIQYHTAITSTNAWSLSPYSTQWKQLKAELNLKNDFLPILQAFLYLIEKRCPLDELPQRLFNYFDVFVAYQGLQPNKLKLIFNKLSEYYPLQELADLPLNNYSVIENRK